MAVLTPMRRCYSVSLLAFLVASATSEATNPFEGKSHSSLRRTLGNNDNSLIQSNTTTTTTTQTPRRRPRIIGGTNVNDPSEYPYFALMNGKALCGAVLIAPSFVLTAAHCSGADDDFEVGAQIIGSGVDISDWWDNLLDNSDSSSGSGRGTEYAYNTRLIHPNYDDDNVSNDIAIYELKEPVPDTVPYVKLRRQALTQADALLTVIGFGDMVASEWISDTSNTLQKTTVNYVTEQTCKQQLGSNISPDMLCAFGRGRDSCGGDSGGPLLLEGSSASSDELVGLVSWGVSCADDTFPGVYTRISHFYDWIVDSMCAMNPDGVPDGVDCGNTAAPPLVPTPVSALVPAPTPVPPVGAVVDDDDDDDDTWTYLDDYLDDYIDDDTGNFFESVWNDLTDWVLGILDF